MAPLAVHLLCGPSVTSQNILCQPILYEGIKAELGGTTGMREEAPNDLSGVY